MLNDTARYVAIRNKTSEVLALANQLYGVDIKPTVSFNLRGKVAGWAGCKFCAGQKTYTLRFNCELIQSKHFEDLRDETVAHEVAHLVCFARPELGRKHDGGWRQICLALGGNGKTRHDYEVTPVGGGITHRTDRGHEVVVSKIIHNKIQQQCRTYRYSNGKGSINRSCAWAVQGQPVEVKATTVVVPAPLETIAPVRPAAATGSKADMVRAWIALAKRHGKSPESVMYTAQVELNMSKSQAYRYVTENWPRVAA